MIRPGVTWPPGVPDTGNAARRSASSVELRPARASDAASAAPLLYESGPRVIAYLFGSEAAALHYFRAAFPRRAQEMSHAHHTVATVEGSVAGVGGAYSGGQLPAFLVCGAWTLLRCFGPRQGIPMIRRALAVERVVQPPRGNLHYIAHVSVAPAYRGHGIGTALVQHLLDQGRQRGRSRAALDVAADNHGAFVFYRRLGFEVTAEIQSSLTGVPNHFRLERPL